ncbi:MAG: PilZ domain-containing protein [Spirochaetota bacterium]
MKETRKSTRVYPKDLIDYSARINVNGAYYSGMLGNLSDTGVCVILPENFPKEEGVEVIGIVHYVPLNEKIEFAGKIIWTKNYFFQNKSRVMIGVQFFEKINNTSPYPNFIKDMNETRKDTRVYTKDFIDYSTRIEVGGSYYAGILGNISETGICVILPENFPKEEGLEIRGTVHHVALDETIQFTGKTVWTDDYLMENKSRVMIGARFSEKIELPDYLFMLSVDLDE